ncbi:hypothetical protein BUALT_Bualt14G0023900 [Buddleja alternifolia]|uniref:Histone-lysine N-methyltransferase ATX2 n=1 Tax=Buddleja alternifolia TaxID=168488 RepID=A0AAV6WG16_9LAMI|nr:hypothetical protein BUALT_Bualt14G0023900 [Buddleja alternifolia]
MAAAAFPSSANFSLLSEERNGVKLEQHEEDDFGARKSPLKYIPLCDVYSATSPCVTATGSKKVKAAAQKPQQSNGHDQLRCDSITAKPPITQVYLRKRKRKEKKSPFLESLSLRGGGLSVKSEEMECIGEGVVEKRRRVGTCKELIKLGVDCTELSKLCARPRLRDGFHKINCTDDRKNRSLHKIVNNVESRKQKNDYFENNLKNSGAVQTKKWVWLSFEDADPKKFIGLQCKVYWPLDGSWYSGHVVGYDSDTGRHHVKYEDGEEENLILSNERIKFHISHLEMQSLKLKCRGKNFEADGIDLNEMVVLAASFDDYQEIEPEDIIWAKLAGHAVWPAIVMDESHMAERKGLHKISGEKSVLVQFFGTYDFARVTRKQVISFLKGLLSSCHLKCKKPTFMQALEEAKLCILDCNPAFYTNLKETLLENLLSYMCLCSYLSEQKLPKRMLQLRHGVEPDINYSNNIGKEHKIGIGLGDQECMSLDKIQKKLEDLKSCPFEVGELRVISLGKIVKDSGNFQNERFIWPEGYTAVRKFRSISDPSVNTFFKMDVLRDFGSRTRPLFRVTTDTGEEFKGSTPSACWNKIYKRIKEVQTSNPDYKAEQNFESGSYMFGFSHPVVSELIKEMSNPRPSSKSSQLASRRTKDLPVGYRPVHVEWRDLDKCNVCHMDEEYENNLFLQCDKCRMMVHARCYGELEPTDGVLWLCNLCRPGAPESPPPCCLCPVIGGAMKPTTDGRWAHLACAIWIPETCLSDIKKMEPIDGLHRINKDRWRLLCSICGVSYGACIQCSNFTCRVAYHPLCARAAGFCLEPEDVDRLHLAPFDEDEEDQCIQLLSFCRKHRPSSNERFSVDERIGEKACEHADSPPSLNPSGCARTEPYNVLRRRGKNTLAAACSKRLYVENKPYLVGGCSPHMPLWNNASSDTLNRSKYSVELQMLQISQFYPCGKILSVADKYNFMRHTFRKRLAFGKSAIHGFGVFAKLPHRAGDMVIEYTGELIRPPVADRREHMIYNSLVNLTLEYLNISLMQGAGTYMFRIDDERVIDATRAGSIAHLINHSCEPNCYSRVISINGDDHIIIFAKRDIRQWEELTYDYRFFSVDERLACYCGSSRCRGVVNDTETEERVAKLYAPSSELKDWQGEQLKRSLSP